MPYIKNLLIIPFLFLIVNKLTTTTILVILILVTGSITVTFLSQKIFAVSPIKKVNGIEITNTKTDPPIVNKQSSFKIISTVLNNSTITIKFVESACGVSPISATFNKNVNLHPTGIAAICKAPLHLITLHPGEKATVKGPGTNVIYKAVGTGKTIAKVIFHYTDESGSNIKSAIKSFVFVIQK